MPVTTTNFVSSVLFGPPRVLKVQVGPVRAAFPPHCAQPVSVHRNQHQVYLVELDSEEMVRSLRPDFARFRSAGIDACIVTARSASAACDFVSRFFAPGMGIDEDPVTGAAHCSLTPYWAQRLGKTELVGHQVSKRGGVVRVRTRGDRVDLLGQAVTVMRGENLR